jgi:hypothetical protein
MIGSTADRPKKRLADQYLGAADMGDCIGGGFGDFVFAAPKP